MISLRDYQMAGVESLRASFRSGKRRPLYVLPTGGGKTAVFSYIGRQASERGRRTLFLVHRQELLRQASESLTRFEVPHGLIAPQYPETRELSQVASVQTVVRRLDRMTPPHLIVVDEAHHASASSYRKIIEAFPDANVLGVTATPCRTDGTGLGEVFDDLIIGPSISSLIDGGYLVRPEVYAPPVGIDLTGVHRKMGDYDKKETEARVDKPKITGDVVAHYKKLCKGEPAIAFCVSIKHAQHVAQEFRDHGISSTFVEGAMADCVRRSAIQGLQNNSIMVLTSADLIGEGVDIPRVSAAILLRPTHSTALFLQQVGRALRPYPGKTRAIILDHVENWKRHGFPDDDRQWSLDGTERSTRGKSDGPIVRIEQCKKCFFVFEIGPGACPSCGDVVPVRLRKIEFTEGELKKLEREEIEHARRVRKTEERGAQSLEALQALGRARGYKPGWAIARFNARGGRVAAGRGRA